MSLTECDNGPSLSPAPTVNKPSPSLVASTTSGIVSEPPQSTQDLADTTKGNVLAVVVGCRWMDTPIRCGGCPVIACPTVVP